MLKDVNQLSGPELDFWVAKAEGIYGGDLAIRPHFGCSYYDGGGLFAYSPSTQWHLAGEMIVRERISTVYEGDDAPDAWRAFTGKTGVAVYGQTPLEAAMRAYIYNKWGPLVDSETVVFRAPDEEDM